MLVVSIFAVAVVSSIDALLEGIDPAVAAFLGIRLQDVTSTKQRMFEIQTKNNKFSTYFVGETTSKQNLRSISVTGFARHNRKSSSITVTSRSCDRRW